jgi:phage regulator Rha-like protein
MSKINDFDLSEMALTRLTQFELILKSKGLAQKTIERKLNDVGMFIIHGSELRKQNVIIRPRDITEYVFEYVRDGIFSEDNFENEGTCNYRRSIFHNIQEGFEFVYEEYKFKNPIEGKLIKDLTKEQIEVLEEISKNKWFRCSSTRQTTGINNSIQAQLISKLGLKVYFDENNKPYVLSHELAENIGKRNVEVMDGLRVIIERFLKVENSTLRKNLDISMIEDTYTYETKTNAGKKEATTFRLSKDLVIHYILGLTGEKYSIFKFEYQAAFNYIEEEYKLLLQKHAELKDSFLKMFNDIGKRNRDLLVQKSNAKTPFSITENKK